MLSRALRIAFVLIMIASTQAALLLSLGALFWPRDEERPARRLLLLGLFTTVAIELAGVWMTAMAYPIPTPLRAFLVEPVLAWFVISVPFALVLGGAIVAAARLRGGTDPRLGLNPARRSLLGRMALGGFGAAALAAGVGIEESERAPELTQTEIPLPGLHPDLDGLRIAQLSDIHAGSLMTEERMAEIAGLVRALKADLVVLTGDLLDVSENAAPGFVRAFQDLGGTLGRFGVLGNHDYIVESHRARPSVEALHAIGARLLRNEGVRLRRGEATLWLGGIDDPSVVERGGSVDPERALAGALAHETRVMLAHRPALANRCVRAGAHLVLSGHTHGGQLALSPRFSMARLIGFYTMGLYRIGDSHLYVHRGMGSVGIAPIRLGSRPEIAVLTLRRA